MATLQAYTESSRMVPLLSAWESGTLRDWAHAHVAACIAGGGTSTGFASGPSGPFFHVVHWTLGGKNFTTDLRDYATQAELDQAIAAFTAAVEAAGGTVTN